MPQFDITDIVAIPLATPTNDGLLSADDKNKLNSLVAGGVASFAGRVGAIVPEAGDYTAELITETDARKVMLGEERDKLDTVETGAQVNTITAVFSRAGVITAHEGDYNAGLITETSTHKIMTGAERDKLAGISAGANPNPVQVGTTEKTDGTENALRSFSPADVKDMATIWGGGGAGGAVSSVFGRTGNVLALSGDYTADKITDGGGKVMMTSAERTKLTGIQAGATVAGAVPSVFGRSGAVVAQTGDYTAAQVGADPEGTASGLVGALTPVSIGAASAVHTHSEADVTDLVSHLAAKAAIASPTFTGTPSAPTAATSDNSTKLATTAFVKAQAYITSVPVSSVCGKTGAVTLNNSDIGLDQVTNDKQLLSSFGYSTKESPATGDKVVIKDGDTGLPRIVDWNQLPSGSVSGTAADPPEIEVSFLTNYLTWTGQPAAATEVGGSQRRKRMNTLAVRKMRVQNSVITPGFAGSYVRPQYSLLTNPSTADADWTDIDATLLDLPLPTTGTSVSTTITFPVAARNVNCWLRFKGVGGNGSVAPVFGNLSMLFELEALRGPPGDKGEKGDAGSAITTRASLAVSGDPPDADAVNLTNTAAVTVNMPTIASGRTAISFRLGKSGGGNVTFQGGTGRTIDGGSLTASHGTPTAPIVYTFVSNPDSPTQWLRWAR